MSRTAIHAFLDVLAAGGVRYLFGNPGTTELPLMDALADDERFRYILGLHEIPATAMADGYAQASRSLGVVNVHICCGLGNAMGMLYNAHRAGTPLLLTAGQQDRRLQLEEPVLAGDMVSVTRPWTKWAYDVQRAADLPTAVRRAVQTALTPPTGPVFLSLPLDVQVEPLAGADVSPPCIPDRRVRPPAAALRRAAEVLAGAKNPGILAGSRVVEADAVAELRAVAERLGAPVIPEAATSHGRVPFPTDHPLHADGLSLWAAEVHRRLSDFDVLFLVGLPVLRQYLYQEPARPIPEHVRLVQLDENAGELAKNYPVEVALLGDIKAGLAELDGLLAQALTPARTTAARERIQRYGAAREQAQQALRTRITEQWDRRPLTPQVLMGAVARVLPANAAVVEEATTTTNTMLERLGALKDPAGYFGHRGWALGWGMGCALGVKLAWPDRPVLALLGEGASLYGIQALWTAAHHGIPATFVICNNAQYQILKHCSVKLPLPNMAAGKFVEMDLTRPEIDFVGLARSFGVEAHRITEPDELSERLRESFKNERPLLLDVPVI